jgi:citronellyl-CoA dehydrogenase
MWESRVSRYFRDSRLLSIGGGADEIMLTIIAKHMGTLPARRQPQPRAEAQAEAKAEAKAAAQPVPAVPAPGRSR